MYQKYSGKLVSSLFHFRLLSFLFLCCIFRLDSKENQQKYGEIIVDFSYFQVSEVLDRRIENDQVREKFISLSDQIPYSLVHLGSVGPR
jgi:Hereditary spastic paraplegia protein strumpellin